jgi:hypothetical protein
MILKLMFHQVSAFLAPQTEWHVVLRTPDPARLSRAVIVPGVSTFPLICGKVYDVRRVSLLQSLIVSYTK